MTVSRQATSEYAKKAGRAVSRVGLAIRSGRLVRQPCVDCGAEKVQAHHHNGYDPEHELDVVWLCRPHHQERHGRRGVLPPWERSGHVRAYMDATRPNRYRDERLFCFSTISTPTRLFKRLEQWWGLLRTDEERAHAVALIERLESSEKGDGMTTPRPGRRPGWSAA